MLTSRVTKKQLKLWERLFDEHKKSLKPNRIDGKSLSEYFKSKYDYATLSDDNFKSIVLSNAEEYGNPDSQHEIEAYVTDENVLVGIDLATGYFHVECKKIRKSVPVYDDLFVARGLDENDLENYVLVGQYLELKSKSV